MNQPPKKSKLICLCNSVDKETIEAAIRRGCNTPDRIFDATTAGVGACGGSCRPTIQAMLDAFAATGQFPESPKPSPSRSRQARRLRRKFTNKF